MTFKKPGNTESSANKNPEDKSYPTGEITEFNPSGKRWFNAGEDYQILYLNSTKAGLLTNTEIIQD